MHHRALAGLATSAVLLLAACSSSGATTAPSAAVSVAPSAEAPAAPSVAASAAPSVAASAAPSVAASATATCSESADAGQVAVEIKAFKFGPADINAKVGQIIAFTNGDAVPHTATLDDGSCSTGTIIPGKADGLLFSVAGTYSFHCKIHLPMKGTITIS